MKLITTSPLEDSDILALGSGLNQLDRSDRFRPISDLSPDQLDPIIQLVETEMVGACLECHASGSLL